MSTEDNNLLFFIHLTLLLRCDEEWKRRGGERLLITSGTPLEVKLVENGRKPDDMDEFTALQQRWQQTPFPPQVAREEVYLTLSLLARRSQQERLIKEIDQRYGAEVYDQHLPRMDILQYLFNENRHAFRI